MPELAANLLIQNGGIALDPTPDRDVVRRETTLGHDLYQIATSRLQQIRGYGCAGLLIRNASGSYTWRPAKTPVCTEPLPRGRRS